MPSSSDHDHTLDPAGAYRVPIEGLGLVFRPDSSERTKRHFREPAGTRRTHVHVRRAGSWAEQFALLFRDYLRVHPEERVRYAEFKRGLAGQLPGERLAYTDAEGPFIGEVMSRADRWTRRSDGRRGLRMRSRAATDAAGVRPRPGTHREVQAA